MPPSSLNVFYQRTFVEDLILSVVVRPPPFFFFPFLSPTFLIQSTGSHAIWHCFIVLAVSQHKSAIGNMKEGLQCMVST